MVQTSYSNFAMPNYGYNSGWQLPAAATSSSSATANATATAYGGRPAAYGQQQSYSPFSFMPGGYGAGNHYPGARGYGMPSFYGFSGYGQKGGWGFPTNYNWCFPQSYGYGQGGYGGKGGGYAYYPSYYSYSYPSYSQYQQNQQNNQWNNWQNMQYSYAPSNQEAYYNYYYSNTNYDQRQYDYSQDIDYNYPPPKHGKGGGHKPEYPPPHTPPPHTPPPVCPAPTPQPTPTPCPAPEKPKHDDKPAECPPQNVHIEDNDVITNTTNITNNITNNYYFGGKGGGRPGEKPEYDHKPGGKPGKPEETGKGGKVSSCPHGGAHPNGCPPAQVQAGNNNGNHYPVTGDDNTVSGPVAQQGEQNAAINGNDNTAVQVDNSIEVTDVNGNVIIVPNTEDAAALIQAINEGRVTAGSSGDGQGGQDAGEGPEVASNASTGEGGPATHADGSRSGTSDAGYIAMAEGRNSDGSAEDAYVAAMEEGLREQRERAAAANEASDTEEAAGADGGPEIGANAPGTESEEDGGTMSPDPLEPGGDIPQ